MILSAPLVPDLRTRQRRFRATSESKSRTINMSTPKTSIHRKRLSIYGILIAFLALSSLETSLGKEWKILLKPASLNADQTLRLAAGQTQVITMGIQADKETLLQEKAHELRLTLDLPQGLEIIYEQGLNPEGFNHLPEPRITKQAGRNLVEYQLTLTKGAIFSPVGSDWQSEWTNHTFFVNTPNELPQGQGYLNATIQEGDSASSSRWKLELQTIAPPRQRPKKTTIGLWDYNYYRARNAQASAGVAKFFKNVGISFTQIAFDESYRKALRGQDITIGGEAHHSVFAHPQHPEVHASGKLRSSNFPDEAGVLALPDGTPIPGVDELIKNATNENGLATFDYEPIGIWGFSDLSIKQFQEKYEIPDSAFKQFRDYVAKNDHKTHQSTDPAILKTWKQWTEYRTHQTSNYVRRIVEAVKAKAPNVKIAVTNQRSYGTGTDSTLALGVDNAAMARHCDIMMPQLYSGYSGAETKFVMRMTQGWRDEIVSQKATTRLWPILLVRYAGATVSNSPERVYQQSIGAMAHGAQGLLFYYPGNMDAPYWSMVARLNEDLAKYEEYYHEGKRVDEKYRLSQLPLRKVEIITYPGYPEPVENPGWAFTAHQLGNKVLLTLMNLEEADDLTFGVDVGQSTKYLSGENVKTFNGKLPTIPEGQTLPINGVNLWSVAAREVAYILLEQE
jgi:hypothetical protein